MAPKLIYYGVDNAHRLAVLRAAGYVVENCKSTSELNGCFDCGAEILVVLFSDEEGQAPLDAIDASRARCTAPLIVFRDSSYLHDNVSYDFIIPNLTPPAEWLQDIASMVEQIHRSAQPASPIEKVLPIDAPPSKIKRIERVSASLADPGLQSFGPAPEDSTCGQGTRTDSRYVI